MFVPAPALRPEHDSRHPLHPVLEQGDRDARGGDRARELGVALKAEILGKYDKNLSNLRLRLFSYNKFKMTIAIKRRLDHVLFDRNNALIEDLHGLAQVGTPLPHSLHTLAFVLRSSFLPRMYKGRHLRQWLQRCQSLTGRLPSCERRAGDAHDA
ncbi:hypothetical protein BD310DRAFT_832393 [Dichomitus squalens]|uniref:Uncharacterized protein n=1 Tax=Dichomitus squalens TaxID=114155 RepID=A0A4Q9PHG9_9APHY|nr:hypothetical protein BD310DRAFT_832393 [Dichomitus squalens]